MTTPERSEEQSMMLSGNQRGASRLKTFVVLVLLGAAFHVGYKIVPVFMDSENMEDTMTTKAGLAQVLKDDEILKDLVNKAKDIGLPLKAENFVIERDTDRRTMTIKTAWDVEVHFFGGLYVHDFHFAPVVQENFMKGI
jgi:hypothetical protein